MTITRADNFFGALAEFYEFRLTKKPAALTAFVRAHARLTQAERLALADVFIEQLRRGRGRREKLSAGLRESIALLYARHMKGGARHEAALQAVCAAYRGLALTPDVVRRCVTYTRINARSLVAER